MTDAAPHAPAPAAAAEPPAAAEQEDSLDFEEVIRATDVLVLVVCVEIQGPDQLRKVCAYYRTWNVAEVATASAAGKPVLTLVGKASRWSGELCESGHLHEWQALSRLPRWDKASMRRISLTFEPSHDTMSDVVHLIEVETAATTAEDDHEREESRCQRHDASVHSARGHRSRHR